MTLVVRARHRLQPFTLDVDFTLPADGVTAVFGRSGCGKTTLLRLIAGLERAHEAHIGFAGEVWQDARRFVPVHRRRIGVVFQEHSLLPHLSVRANLEYGYRRTPAAARRHTLPEVAALLGIDDLLARSIDRLSGGQRQRVALGRALLASPRLLLLDEPLAALDHATKREIMPFLARLAQQAGVPIVLVTHAPDEVERLADRVVFLRDGRVERIEPLREALARSDSPLFVDDGPAAVLEGELHAGDARGLCAFDSGAVRLLIAATGQTPGPRRRLRILARDVSIALEAPQRISILNHLPASIEGIGPEQAGRVTVGLALADGQRLLAQITPWSARQLALAPGQSVFALIKSVALID